MAPLGIGLLALLLAASLLIALASDLLLSHRRLEALAESLALAAYQRAIAISLDEVPSAEGEALAREYLAILAPHPAGEPEAAQLVLDADGTLTARLCGRWQAPFKVLGLASKLNLCAEARARTSAGSDR